MKPIKVFVLVNMTVNSFTGPDVGWMIRLELETVPIIEAMEGLMYVS